MTSHAPANHPQTPRGPVLLLTVTVVAAVVVAELLLDALFPSMPDWQARLATIVIAGLAAALAGARVFRRLGAAPPGPGAEPPDATGRPDTTQRPPDLRSLSEDLRVEVAERQSVEASLTEWKNRYEAATEATGNVLYDWNSTTNDVTWGGNHEGVLGYSRSEMVGGLDRWLELIHPVDRVQLDRDLKRLLERRGAANFTYRMRRKDGHFVTVRDRGRFFFDASGGAVHMVGFIEDITEHTAAREALREGEERMRAIVETATEAIITTDQNGIVDSFNLAAESYFGYVAEEVLGENVSLLMTGRDRERHDEYIQRYLDTGERRIIGLGREVIGRRKDGSTFPIDLSIAEGLASGRRFFTAILRDVTERKEMEAKLGQTERLAAVGELAAGVAHEVNNPVNTMINCAQLIKDGDSSADLPDVIIQEGSRISSIVRDLLQFARDDRDRPQPTPIHEVLQRTLSLVGENFKRHGIAIHDEIPDDLPEVRARPQQLQQVFLNLLINAKDALKRDGANDAREIRISGSVTPAASPAVVQLLVRDNGTGIRPGLLRRVFEPFVTTKRAYGGTGLGLSVSRSILEEYGGSLDAASEEGEFTEFRITLPLAEDGSPPSPQQGPPVPSGDASPDQSDGTA